MKTIHELHSPNVSVFCCSVILLRSLTIVQSLPSMTHLSDGPGKCTHTKHKYNLSGLPYRNGFCIAIMGITVLDPGRQETYCVCRQSAQRRDIQCDVSWATILYWSDRWWDSSVSCILHTHKHIKTVYTFFIKKPQSHSKVLFCRTLGRQDI